MGDDEIYKPPINGIIDPHPYPNAYYSQKVNGRDRIRIMDKETLYDKYNITLTNYDPGKPIVNSFSVWRLKDIFLLILVLILFSLMMLSFFI